LSRQLFGQKKNRWHSPCYGVAGTKQLAC
jgi:hypothetical protein